jgi:hypothetical protein
LDEEDTNQLTVLVQPRRGAKESRVGNDMGLAQFVEPVKKKR